MAQNDFALKFAQGMRQGTLAPALPAQSQAGVQWKIMRDQAAQAEAERQGDAANVARLAQGLQPSAQAPAGMAEPAQAPQAPARMDPAVAQAMAQQALIEQVAATSRALAESEKKKPVAKKSKPEVYRQAPGAEQDGY